MKFRNIPNNDSGESYRSLLETTRHKELKLMAKANPPLVRNIRREVPYRLVVNGFLIKTYYADYVYEECCGGVWREVIEDVKSAATMTRDFNITKKLFRALIGQEIRIVVSDRAGGTQLYSKKIPSRKLPTGRKIPSAPFGRSKAGQ